MGTKRANSYVPAMASLITVPVSCKLDLFHNLILHLKSDNNPLSYEFLLSVFSLFNSLRKQDITV